MRCGERVKKVRETMGLTQAEFGARLGFKWDKIKNIETNLQKLTPEIALDIEDKFSFSFRWLLTGKGSMTADAPADAGSRRAPGTPLDPITATVVNMMSGMDDARKREILKYAEEKKLLLDLLTERRPGRAGARRGKA